MSSLIAILIVIILLAAVAYFNKRSEKRDWTQDIVLITGGCGNIGQALYKKLDKLGAKVFLLDIKCDNADLGPAFIKCDVTDRNCIHKMLSEYFDKHSPTILINNCAIFNHGKSFLELSDNQFDNLMNVNFGSYVDMTRMVLPKMLTLTQTTPWIVNVASCLGLVGVSFVTDYCASKFAIYGFTEALRMELEVLGKNVKVMTVCPFFVQNGLFPQIKIKFPWITPTLSADHVADAIIKGIEANKQEIWMPWFVYFVPIFRMLPSWILDSSQILIGTHKSL